MNAVNTKPAWLIILTVMLAAVLEVLDGTIVNVALPSMMPALSADQNQITWVLTAYVVASAIMLPLTGFLSNRLGRKRMMVTCVTGFMLSSFLCGMTGTIDQMVFFRIFQGAFGAALIPLSQATLRESFPLNKQGKAMAIWGMGIMMAPVFGPTLGGFITQDMNWRWIFYLNIPICLSAIALTVWVIPNSEKIKQKIDYFGLGLMVIGIGMLQIFLDQGNSKSWFSSNFILIIAIISALCIIGFLIRTYKHKTPVITLWLYKNRNFAIASVIMACFAGGLFGMLTVQPIMLERVFNYPIITTGLVMAPLGIGSGFGMVLVSIIMNKISVKWIIATGLFGCALGASMFYHVSPDASMMYFIIPNYIQGFSMGLIMVPISTYALVTISKKNMAEAAGLFAYSRMLGTSVGISLISTLISRQTQVNWHDLGGHINRFSQNLTHWLTLQHTTLHNPHTVAQLAAIVGHQASLQAFINTYFAIALVFVLLIPLAFFFEPVDLTSSEMIAH
jgi:MFS transporter, DHA2 family, multidrug resistance protein